MLELEPNTLAFMTAAREQCCKKLKNDTPEAREFIADKLKECARRGRASQTALAAAGEAALAERNDGRAPNRQTRNWLALASWFT
jgi:urease gamma subunit